ncbi:MAG: hypothetical protein IKZ29_09390 [Clostridiales bacterium]|nr:hypothetical protein [Clostridiales bacterium]
MEKNYYPTLENQIYRAKESLRLILDIIDNKYRIDDDSGEQFNIHFRSLNESIKEIEKAPDDAILGYKDDLLNIKDKLEEYFSDEQFSDIRLNGCDINRIRKEVEILLENNVFSIVSK